MPISTQSAPEGLRPYLNLGVDLQWREGDKEAKGECPFCGGSEKFSVDIEKGVYRCFVCAEGSKNGGGNARIFVRRYHSLCFDQTTDYRELSSSRKIKDTTLIRWGVCRGLDGQWLVPAYGAKGEINTLYRYTIKSGNYGGKLMATAELGAGYFRPDSIPLNYASKIYITEGPWDGMALWEILNSDSESIVIAVPGANTFTESWAGLDMFQDKDVVLLYDNDHPIMKNGKRFLGAGFTGMKRASGLLTEAGVEPERISYLDWGEGGCNPTLPSGFDIRDVITGRDTPLNSCFKGHSTPLERFGELERRITLIPREWVRTRDNASKNSGKSGDKSGNYGELPPLECTEWEVLQSAWKEAMEWTDGLDCALSVMLASVLTTQLIGEQLWIKIISPPGCLDGETPIYDPVDKSTKTVHERFLDGVPFNVWTRDAKGEIKESFAYPPTEFPEADVYEVKFQSGRSIRVTAGHRFWNGSSYVALHAISEDLLKFGSYRLPSISEPDLSIQTLGVPRCSQIAEGYRGSCYVYPCLYDEQLLRELGTSLHGSPLPGDALASYKNSGDALSERECKCNPLQTCDPPPSMMSSLHHIGTSDASEERGIFLDKSEPFERLYLVSPQLVGLRDRSSRGLMPPPFDVPAKGDVGIQFRDRLVSWRRGIVRLLRFGLSLLETFQNRIARYISQFSLSTIPALPVYVFQLPADEDIFEELDSRHLASRKSQQGCNPLGKVERLSGFSCGTTASTLVDSLEGKRFLTKFDYIESIEFVKRDVYYDFHVPITNNYWAQGFFHHNSGKTTLLEGLSVAKKYLFSKDTIRGFYTGFGTSADDDNSIAALANGKTLAIKDGDTLLKSPNLPQILSEGRGLYDGAGRTHYRNSISRDYEGHRMTWLLCGTSALREIDDSELGSRFLDCVIMEGIDEEFERSVGLRAGEQELKNLLMQSNGVAEERHNPDQTRAMQLTGGYVEYLRENDVDIMSSVSADSSLVAYCNSLASFVSRMRARPSRLQEEESTREFSARLVKQLVRLSVSLAAVMGKSSVDSEVKARVNKVARDTSRGITLEIAGLLFERGMKGYIPKALGILTDNDPGKMLKLLRFLKRIGVVKNFKRPKSDTILWRLTDTMRELYVEVMDLANQGEDDA